MPGLSLERHGLSEACSPSSERLGMIYASVVLADHPVAPAADPTRVLVLEALQRAFGVTPEVWPGVMNSG